MCLMTLLLEPVMFSGEDLVEIHKSLPLVLVAGGGCEREDYPSSHMAEEVGGRWGGVVVPQLTQRTECRGKI